MGNIKGAKRGSYKKTILKTKTNDKKITSAKNSEAVTTTKRNLDEVINRIKSHELDSIEHNEPGVNADTNSGVSETENKSNGAPSGEAQASVFQETSGEEKLNSFFAEYEQVNENTEASAPVTDQAATTENIGNQFTSSQSSNNNLSKLVNGYMLLTMMDIVFPLGIKFIFGLFNKDAKRVNTADLRLETEQKDSLQAMADQVASYIFEKVNPLTMFVLMSAMYYGTNLQTAINNLPKENKK